jgi:hypothetical protein
MGSDINKYLPGPHYDPPSKEKLKALMDVITSPLPFYLIVIILIWSTGYRVLRFY